MVVSFYNSTNRISCLETVISKLPFLQRNLQGPPQARGKLNNFRPRAFSTIKGLLRKRSWGFGKYYYDFACPNMLYPTT